MMANIVLTEMMANILHKAMMDNAQRDYRQYSAQVSDGQ